MEIHKKGSSCRQGEGQHETGLKSFSDYLLLELKTFSNDLFRFKSNQSNKAAKIEAQI